MMLSIAAHLALSVLAQSIAAKPNDTCSAPVAGRQVPASLVSNRWFVRWHLFNGRDAWFYTDTDGPALAIYPEGVARLGLHVDTLRAEHSPRVVRLRPDSAFPMPTRIELIRRWNPAYQPASWMTEDFLTQIELMVWPESPAALAPGLPMDGSLGVPWFAGGVWIFDYPNARMYFNGREPAGPATPNCWIPVGFQADSTGHLVNFHPRIAATIDGEVISLLVDTGARTTLTDPAWQSIGRDEPRGRATSFITKDHVDQWHNRHPDWLVIENAEEETGFRMIRVPSVEVGGQRFGPVWFTERPTPNFREFMSRYTDHPVEGALGGSAWRYVTLVLDYPRARAAVMSNTK